jgi:hypothetical protein
MPGMASGTTSRAGARTPAHRALVAGLLLGAVGLAGAWLASAPRPSFPPGVLLLLGAAAVASWSDARAAGLPGSWSPAWSVGDWWRRPGRRAAARRVPCSPGRAGSRRSACWRRWCRRWCWWSADPPSASTAGGYYPVAGETSAAPKYAHNQTMLAVVVALGWLALRDRGRAGDTASVQP